MKNNTMRSIEQRAQRYWFEDGIWEIGFGLVNLVLGIFFFVTTLFNWTGPMALVLLVLQLGVFLGAFWLINRVVKTLKERITYPRTGFVAYRRRTTSARVRQMIMAAVISISIGGLTGILSSLDSTTNRTPLVAGVFMALAVALIGRRFSLQRLYILAALTLLLGFGVSRAPITVELSSSAFFTGFGLLMLFSGAITLAFYLRNTEPARQDLLDYDPQAENDFEDGKPDQDGGN